LNTIHPLARTRGELKERIVGILSNETMDFGGWFRNMLRYVEKALARHEFV